MGTYSGTRLRRAGRGGSPIGNMLGSMMLVKKITATMMELDAGWGRKMEVRMFRSRQAGATNEGRARLCYSPSPPSTKTHSGHTTDSLVSRCAEG